MNLQNKTIEFTSNEITTLFEEHLEQFKDKEINVVSCKINYDVKIQESESGFWLEILNYLGTLNLQITDPSTEEEIEANIDLKDYNWTFEKTSTDSFSFNPHYVNVNFKYNIVELEF